MQSTKKAPLRKEDGTTAASDDVATIAQSANIPNVTQPVRQVNKNVTIGVFFIF